MKRWKLGKAIPPQASPPDVFRDAEFPLTAASWKGTPVLVKVRELSAVQLRACGDFSLINLGEVTDGPFQWQQWAQYADIQYRILKAALASPSYEEIFAIVGKGPMVENAERKFREIDQLLLDMPRGPGKQALEKERDSLRCMFDYLLPEDFVASVIAYAIGMDKSDIKLVTRSILLDAAVLAHQGNDNPADHIHGLFTHFNRDDINRRGWEVFHQYREDHKHGARGPQEVRNAAG